MTEQPADFLTLVRSPVAVRELAADTLRQAIIRGDLLPGGRLVEAELSKRMGVSRPSIREALSQLAAEKLVTIVPNKGPSVANISWKEAQEIYHVRSLVEGEASFLFAGRASKADLAGMRTALKAFERAMARDDTSSLVASTGAFYGIMLNGCGNGIITELLAGLNARIGVLRARSMSRPGRARHSLAEMTAMLERLENGDAEGARAATHSHVRAAAAAARESFEQLAQQKQHG
ncbi:GntR family transcriptional regulator [Bradyrhizobium prioriisuperbiae]|uniref:GntR family transcriptional regulator n=1 Tax=Bradyrhizobium prioriisuperbiae TaxID=2854389 RepID=UPI0028EBC6D6|nr:GntR family transcriptional regulator [Bradyrhizobium prioritasuperba]